MSLLLHRHVIADAQQPVKVDDKVEKPVQKPAKKTKKQEEE